MHGEFNIDQPNDKNDLYLDYLDIFDDTNHILAVVSGDTQYETNEPKM